MINQVGVCSWSLQPDGVEALLNSCHDCGITRVQIALCPLVHWPDEADRLREAIRSEELTLCSGMMVTEGEDYSTLESIRVTGGLRPDEHWDANLDTAKRCADLAAELGLELVSLHAGFIDEENPLEKQKLIDRICRVANEFNQHGITLGLETGQETADGLMDVLSTIQGQVDVGVNFDPANMLLYGMGDPIQAMQLLREHIVHVHMKDAISTKSPGTWGEEVAAGTGEVDWDAFFDVVQGLDRKIDVVIEREAGDQRVEDIRTALRLAQQQMDRVNA